MRKLSRLGFAAAAAGALALGVATTALAEPGDHTNNADQVSQFVAHINSNLQDEQERKPASLMVQVTHYDKNNDNGCGTPGAGPPPCVPVIPGAPPETDELAFDKDLKLTTGGLARCDHTATYDLDNNDSTPAVPFGAMDTQQALDACAKAQVGTGTAIARLPGEPRENSEITETVTAFNGNKVNDNPSILLHVHADHSVNPTVILTGEIRDDTVPDTSAPGGAVSSDEYGKELFIAKVPDLGSDFASLVLTNVQVQKKFKVTKRGNTIKKHYVSARCTPDAVDTDGAGVNGSNAGYADNQDPDGEWDFNAYWTYQRPAALGGATTEDEYQHVQECAQK